ncbi:exodeoxyribonuclease V subunit alpha [Kineosporia sp. A_224]|uniref:exodeoxyribonuclease V subunit alpha n=1 Tax=Kineosporia sp. A_224 TaxID=1962180 RepID=UPI000B4B8726|nr:exodeoxyribonuclease V subunit alpha [Kineosporia sp. A_224]
MTATDRRSAPVPARVALTAGPVLRAFNDAGILASADVQVARRLGRLTGEDDERVLLAVGLAVRALRSGSVCVALDDLDALAVPEAEDGVLVAGTPAAGLPWPEPAAWRAAILGSPLVAPGPGAAAPHASGGRTRVPDPPVRWVDGRLYLDRYWRDEQVVRAEVDGRLARGLLGVEPVVVARAVARLFPVEADGRQRLAAATAALSRVTVVTGGPGTGKTTTVARLLAVLQSVGGAPLRVALAAPTGKAAARLQEAVRAEAARFGDEDRRRVGEPEATTVHRLLGWKPGSSTRFAHDRDHRLPHDVVVVDETSMVSLTLMARLVDALRPDARLVLVGDPDQLASVEAGAVLGDLVARPPVADDLPAALARALPADADVGPEDSPALRNGVVRLTRTHRFDGAIGELATAIRSGDADAVLAVLRRGDTAVTFVDTSGALPDEEQAAGVRAEVAASGRAVLHAARGGDVATALGALETHRLLLAHRRGPFGVARWAALAESWALAAAGPEDADDGRAHHGRWYPGRPLIVTANDRDTGLYNGDTGVLVADGTGLVAAFGDPRSPLVVRPHRLPAVETVYATTVHRGQGSQFRSVSVVLPPQESPLLTRELLYTAVTRAREQVRVLGGEAAVRAAVERPVRRASGLRFPLIAAAG